MGHTQGKAQSLIREERTQDIKRKSHQMGCGPAHTPRILIQQKERAERCRKQAGRWEDREAQ